tara:strand:+ start:1342 stop:2619 length:1278 start_codon:yes stop_codon:yes gene_type:complete
MNNKPRVLIVGPVCNISGYSEHARTLLDSFVEMQDVFDVYVQDTQWAAATHSLKYYNKYKNLINKTNNLFQSRVDQEGRVNIAGLFDCTYQVRPPNEFQQMSENDIGVTAALETTFAPPEWVSKCNLMKNILVVSEHAKKNLKKTKDQNGVGISTPITVIPFGYDSTVEKVDIYKDMEITTEFNFLTVLQLAPRKNFENMLKWFVEEFKDNDKVGLVVKAHMQNNSTLDFHSSKTIIKGLLDTISPNRKCKIYFVHGNFSEQEMASLYNPEYIDCYVTTTHGEGFGIPIFNAACNKIPVIATNWSGHLDFLRAPVKSKTGKVKLQSHFLKVDYKLDKVQSQHIMPGLIVEGCEWAYPDETSFKKNLRFISNNKGSFLEEAHSLSTHLLDKYDIEKIKQKYKEFHQEHMGTIKTKTYNDISELDTL